MANKKKKKSGSKKKTNVKKNTKKKTSTRKKSTAKKSIQNSTKKVISTGKSESKKKTIKNETNNKKEVDNKKELTVKTKTTEPLVIKEKNDDEIKNSKSKEEKSGYLLTIKNVIKKNIKYIVHFICLVIVILFLIFVVLKIRNKNSEVIVFDKINMDTYLNLCKENNESQYIYLSSNDCINCDAYEKNLKKLENEYKINIKELSVSDLNDEELKKLKDSNLYINDNIETPVLLSIKNNNGMSGIKEYNALKRFIDYSQNKNGTSFTRISVSDYLNLLKSKDKTLIYICESSDAICEEFSKTLESVTIKKGTKVHYLDTNEIITEENWNKLNNSNKIFEQNWTKPVIMIVKSNKILGYKMYSMSEADLTAFLSKNGL